MQTKPHPPTDCALPRWNAIAMTLDRIRSRPTMGPSVEAVVDAAADQARWFVTVLDALDDACIDDLFEKHEVEPALFAAAHESSLQALASALDALDLAMSERAPHTTSSGRDLRDALNRIRGELELDVYGEFESSVLLATSHKTLG